MQTNGRTDISLSNTSLSAVVFDLDGLMFNTEELYVQVGTELLRRRGKTLTRELLDQMMGRRSHEALQTMIDFHELSATVDELLADTDEIFPTILERDLAPMPGLWALLEEIEQRQLSKAIATSSRRTFALDVLNRFQLLDRFAFVLTAEDVTRGKPDPEIYQTAAERLRVNPRRMMVLEDSEKGCEAAVQAGAFVVAVPGDHNRHHQHPGVDLTVESLADPRIAQVL